MFFATCLFKRNIKRNNLTLTSITFKYNLAWSFLRYRHYYNKILYPENDVSVLFCK